MRALYSHRAGFGLSDLGLGFWATRQKTQNKKTIRGQPVHKATISPVTALLANSWRLRIHRGKTARISYLIGSFCENIARLSSWETGKITHKPSSASTKQGVSQQPVAQHVYHSDHHPMRQSASDPQGTWHSPRYSIPINFSGRQKQVKLIVL